MPMPGDTASPPRERSSIDDIIELYKKDVDRTLLREALKLSPEQRLDRLYELVRFAEELAIGAPAPRRRGS